MNLLETNLFEETILENHINNLAFSRTATTVGETKAVIYIEDILKKEELPYNIEFFDWTGPKRFLLRLFYVIFFVYLLIYRAIVVIIAFYALKYLFPKLRHYSLIQREESKNIYTKISALNQKDKRPLVIFCAHYDSFSAAAPYRLQNVLFFIFRVIIIPYFMLMIFFSVIILTNIFELYENRAAYEPMILLSTSIEFAIILLIFLLIYNNNKSKGSIDNASGVSILIELARTLNKNPPKNIDILILWTGAEEWGLIGAKRFFKRHRNELEEIYNLDKSYAINIDMVGTYIGLLNKSGIARKKTNRDLNLIIEASAKKLNIPITIYSKLIRPSTDFLIFKKFAKRTKTKFQTACIHSAKDSKFIHSSKDTPDKIMSKNLSGCLDICNQTIKYIDSKS